MSLRTLFKKCVINNLAVLAVTMQLVSCSGGDGGVLMPASDLGSVGFPTSISLSWDAPMLRSDGATKLESTEIKNYRIYFGVKSGEYLGFLDVAGGASTKVNVPGLPPGTYYIVIVTIDTEGRESLYSPEVVKTA